MIFPPRRPLRLLLAAALLAGLVPAAGDASPSRRSGPAAAAVADPATGRAALAMAEAKRMLASGERIWCVPFARTLSGIDIKGNAKTWWAGAAGRYDRGADPRTGAVMVFSGTRKMPLGHIAVVAQVVSDRVIRVDQANWTRNKVTLGVAVMDVSQAGDWSSVRVEGKPGVWGRTNPVSGFIYPSAPEEVRVATVAVVRDR